MRMTNRGLVLVLHLIGWEVSAGFLNQSQSKEKPNRRRLDTQMKIVLFHS